jgi:hypothetical protein
MHVHVSNVASTIHRQHRSSSRTVEGARLSDAATTRQHELCSAQGAKEPLQHGRGAGAAAMCTPPPAARLAGLLRRAPGRGGRAWVWIEASSGVACGSGERGGWDGSGRHSTPASPHLPTHSKPPARCPLRPLVAVVATRLLVCFVSPTTALHPFPHPAVSCNNVRWEWMVERPDIGWNATPLTACGPHRASRLRAAVWQFGFNTPSPIDALLDKEDVTLAEVFAEDDLIQECKAINPKLVDL